MTTKRQTDTKVCRSCGRRFAWRKRWSLDWDEVRYCSAACRSRKVTAFDQRLEKEILSLLKNRGGGKTICPSEVARLCVEKEAAGAEPKRVREEAWRSLMEPVRRAARRLVEAGRVEITQGGRVVDPSAAKGAIRIRAAR